jgi:hypothetical protein
MKVTTVGIDLAKACFSVATTPARWTPEDQKRRLAYRLHRQAQRDGETGSACD